MKKGLKITFGIMAALVAVFITLSLLRPAGGLPGRPGAPPEGGLLSEPAAAIRVAAAEEGSVENRLSLAGEVSATGLVNVVPETNGLLSRVLVSPGDRVFADQIVAWVDPSRPGMAYAESPVRSKRAGTVTAVPAVAGNQVSVQSVIAQVGDLERLEVEIRVPEKYLGVLEEGMEGRITSRAYPDEVLSAGVTEISPVVDPRSRTVTVTLEPAANGSLRPGQSVSVDLILDSRDRVVLVDRAAVVDRFGGSGVFIPADDSVRWQPVETGGNTGGQIEIVTGLEAGTSVVVAGLDRITDGSAVRIIENQEG